MDPLSLSASIAGLVSLADLVYRASTKYVRGFKGAREEAQNLSREIRNFSLVLHNLSLIAFDLEEGQSLDGEPGSQQLSGLKPQHLHDCQQLLMKLEKGLFIREAQIDSSSRLERLQGRLKLPFSSEETKELIQDVQRQKQTIDLALGAESLGKLKTLLSRQSDTNDRVEKVQLTVEELLKAQSKIANDKKHNDVLDAFKKASPHREFETNRNLRYDLTGLWLTEGPDFLDWYTTAGSRIWFTGIPGAGKSVIAAAIIEECLRRNAGSSGTSLAYFFCTYRDENTHDVVSIFSSLCAQLALQNEQAFQKLEEYYDELRSDRSFHREPSAEGLTKVLHSMCTVFSKVYLVIDGLDECGEHVATSVRKLAALTKSSVSEVIRLALLSRDEIAIREILEGRFHNVEIAAHTEDIRLYVAAKLEERIARRELRLRDLTLKDQILDRLVNGAKGMFRWVACQLDHLCELQTDRARKQALDQLPPTLFATYERILMKIERYSEDVRRMVQRTLLFISAPSPRTRVALCFEEASEVISLADGSDTLDEDEIVEKADIMRWCSSLVRTCSDGFHIEFAHFSVKEYLQGECLKHPILSFYGVSEEKACGVIGSFCIRYLTLKDHERLPRHEKDEIGRILERRKSRPFYEHASISWPYYLDRVDRIEKLSHFIFGFFQLPKTPSFCAWAIEFLCHCDDLSDLLQHSAVIRGSDYLSDITMSLATISAVLRPDFTPLHMAAALWMPDLCRHLLKEGANPNLRSKFGTPLQCAIGGLLVFTKQGKIIDPHTSFEYYPQDEFSRGYARRDTVKIMLEAGSRTDLQFRSPLLARPVSNLSLAVIASNLDYGFEIVVDLIESGITILDEDLPNFRPHYDVYMKFGWKVLTDDPHNGEKYVKLLETIGNQTMMGAAASRLYHETLRLVTNLGIPMPNQPLFSLSEEELFKLLKTWIEQNDVRKLETFLETGQSEAIRRIRFNEQGRDWTVLHLATYRECLDVLNALLEFGLDPNIGAADGTTPLHLCTEVDIFRALLQHGASTHIPDKQGMTVWHCSSYPHLAYLMDQLLELDDKDIALQMVSSKNETPICAALNLQKEEYISALLKYCNSKECWKSGHSIFQEATSQGSSAVIKVLLEVGVELDGMDTYSGNPLHGLSEYTDLDCILMLKSMFPLDQRREKDNLTPAELMLVRSLRDEVKREKEIFIALLPATALSDASEASALWAFACSTAVSTTTPSEDTGLNDWIKCVFDTLIELGITKLYEEGTNSSALLPFMSQIDDRISLICIQAQQYFTIGRLSKWDWFSDAVNKIAKISNCLAGAIDEHGLVRLLFAAVLCDDYEMISWLIKNGVDIHSKVDGFSSLEFACLPDVQIGEQGFDVLVAHACPEKVDLELHYTAGLGRLGNGSILKLKRLLQAMVDCNLPITEEYGPPLVHHINRGALNTAEALLEAGADPWARGTFPYDAALAAVKAGHVFILNKILAMSRGNHFHHWNQTWADNIDGKWHAGGNALHLAASEGKQECLEFYLDRELLRDLEAVDYNLETPMHYAARSNRCFMMEILRARGANIDAKNKFGMTPLHLATLGQHIAAVLTLIKLGAKHEVCDEGLTPLAYAQQNREQVIIKALEGTYGVAETHDNTFMPQKRLRDPGLESKEAILKSDIALCKLLHARGIPIDMEKDTRIIQWLLDSGATVSTIFPEPYLGRFSNALEAALGQAELNHLLPNLLTRFGNYEALEIILGWLQATYLRKDDSTTDFSTRRSSSSYNPLSAYTNQRNALWPHDSVLHSAARSGTVESIKLLVDNGANLEEPNSYNNTPLHVAVAFGSLEVVECLLAYGARPDAPNESDCTPLMVACSHARWEVMETLVQYYQGGMKTDSAGRSLLHILIQYTDANHETPNERIFRLCLDSEVDIHRVNSLGWSAIHGLLVSPKPTYLWSLLNRDAHLLQPRRMAPWSDNLFGYNVEMIDTLAKRLRWLSPLMTKDDMHHLSGLTIPGNHSLLCRAACWNSTEALENFLAAGVDDLEHRCDDHGTPLVAAISRLRIKAVKTLVRNGAKVPYQLSPPRDWKISMANTEFIIRQWLFVGRYLERRGIADDAANDAVQVGGWGGPRTAQVTLRWEWRRASDETMLEYASRRQKILRSLRGKVVKPVKWVDSVCDWKFEG
ncbi:ankyrin repeat protein [Fusarium austroafricanum]|uniref:Ankyrin repeat protein n=1 Tax=Fusarium austroafricanum TaxID=2364996 RepID=A0A8H4K8P7_9HYPO|nr:ankyrin repeat protein [Fusarium austroafricanum]